MRNLALLKTAETAHAPAGFIESLKCNYAFVGRNASHVAINYDILESYAIGLPSMEEGEVLDSTHHFISNDTEANISYIITLDSINFGSGFQNHLKDEGYEQPEGFYFKVAKILKNYYETRGPLSPQALSQLSAFDVAEIMELPNIRENPYSFRLASSYSTALNEVAQHVIKNYNGSFLEMVNSCGGQAENFVYMLSRLSSYNDTCLYRGQRVPFYKRALSCAADLNDMYEHMGQDLFHDIHTIPCLADCDIPHVLRMDNILQYDAELTEIIDNHELIEAGSSFEIELRACAVHAVEIMAAKSGRSAIELDRVLWHRAQEDAYKTKSPHRTETKFY